MYFILANEEDMIAIPSDSLYSLYNDAYSSDASCTSSVRKAPPSWHGSQPIRAHMAPNQPINGHNTFSKPINDRKIPLVERVTITHLIKENGKIGLPFQYRQTTPNTLRTVAPSSLWTTDHNHYYKLPSGRL